MRTIITILTVIVTVIIIVFIVVIIIIFIVITYHDISFTNNIIIRANSRRPRGLTFHTHLVLPVNIPLILILYLILRLLLLRRRLLLLRCIRPSAVDRRVSATETAYRVSGVA